MVRSKASLYNGRMQSNADKAAPDLYTYMTRSSVSLTSLSFVAESLISVTMMGNMSVLETSNSMSEIICSLSVYLSVMMKMIGVLGFALK